MAKELKWTEKNYCSNPAHLSLEAWTPFKTRYWITYWAGSMKTTWGHDIPFEDIECGCCGDTQSEYIDVIPEGGIEVADIKEGKRHAQLNFNKLVKECLDGEETET